MMLRFVVALLTEARPLIDFYGMESAERDGAFRTFHSEEASLVISGVGKRAAAAATAYLHAKTGEAPFAVWLNVGVAGHRRREIGELLLAHAVSDASTGERWYPTRLTNTRLDTSEVVSVDVPETVFSTEAAYDMEASGFYPTALTFSTAELVHSIKMVSDNARTPAEDVTPARVRRLVESNLEDLTEAAAQLRRLAEELSPLRLPPSGIDQFERRWRFTLTERRRLHRLLARRETLAPGKGAPAAHYPEAWPVSELLRRLEEEVRRLAFEESVY